MDVIKRKLIVNTILTIVLTIALLVCYCLGMF